MKNVNLLLIWLGLSVGNLVYQALASGNYSAALERSFYQATALFMVWLCAKVSGTTHG